MAIIDYKYNMALQNCGSFSELAHICNAYPSFCEKYPDKIQNKIESLPAELDNNFIDFLIQHCRADNKYIDYNTRRIYIILLKMYSNKIADSNILSEYTIQSQYIPVIIFSTEYYRENQFNIKYLTDTLPELSEDACKKLFYHHAYDLTPEECSDRAENTKTAYLSYLRAVDILTSQGAYDDYIYKFAIEEDHIRRTDYLWLRSEKIYNQYNLKNKKLIDTNSIDIMDIYYFLTYLITTIESNQNYLSSFTPKGAFEKAIRNIYDSIDMIIQNIPLFISQDENYLIQDGYDRLMDFKKNVINAIIDEAFLYMNTYMNLNDDNLRKYFVIKNTIINTDDVIYNPDKIYSAQMTSTNLNPIYCERIIRDTPTLMYNKASSPIATEAYDRNSSKMDAASRKIYKGYKAYKDAENKVDSQITKLCTRIKNVFTGQKTARDKIVEGEQFSAIKILKKIFTTAAIFSYSKIAGVLYIIVKHYCSNAVTNKERKKLIGEIELEIKMLDEKIEDARGDGNRQAKYSMMRTRAELQKALEQIKYGLTASEKAMHTAKSVMKGKVDLNYNGSNRDDD